MNGCPGYNACPLTNRNEPINAKNIAQRLAVIRNTAEWVAYYCQMGQWREAQPLIEKLRLLVDIEAMRKEQTDA